MDTPENENMNQSPSVDRPKRWGRLPKIFEKFSRVQRPERTEQNKNEPTYDMIAQLVDTATTSLGNQDLSENERKKAVLNTVTRPEVTEILQHIGLSFEVEGDNFSLRTEDDIKQQFPINIPILDGTYIIEKILLETAHLRSKPLTLELQRQFPQLNLEPFLDIGAYFYEKGIQKDQSSLVDTYLDLMSHVERATSAVHEFDDHTPVSLFSLDGSSAIVFTDDTQNIIYKVYKFGDPEIDKDGEDARHARNIKYASKEVANLKSLHESGITPKFISSNIDDPDIVTPIVVMEKIDTIPLEEIDKDILRSEGLRIANFIWNKGFGLGEIETVWDKNAGKMRIIDIGALKPRAESTLKDEVESFVLDSLPL